MAVKRKKSHFSLGKAVAVACACCIAVIAVSSVGILKDVKKIDISSDITIQIPEGAGSSLVAQLLYDNDIIKYPEVFRLSSKLGGFDGEYKPGTVTVSPDMSYDDILNVLVVSERDLDKVVIPEGYNIKQIAETLENAQICTAADFRKALDPTLYDYKFLKNLPERENKLEGYLFPATYDFKKGTSAQEVVNAMLERFDEAFGDKYYTRAKEVNITVDEAITMASIVERETNAEGERAKVAGVFYNRLNSDMKLESCATVQYILGTNKPVLTVADTQTDSPYNTYLHKGLPIGPICSPGAECIKAALYPEKTEALYFLLGTDGKHIFSKTYEEHQKAMNENGL